MTPFERMVRPRRTMKDEDILREESWVGDWLSWKLASLRLWFRRRFSTEKIVVEDGIPMHYYDWGYISAASRLRLQRKPKLHFLATFPLIRFVVTTRWPAWIRAEIFGKPKIENYG